MKYFYVPVSPRGLTEDNLEKMAEALEASEGEVFAYCRTGNRTGVLLTRLVNQPVELSESIAPHLIASQSMDKGITSGATVEVSIGKPRGHRSRRRIN